MTSDVEKNDANALTSLLTQTNNEATLSVLHDMFNAMEDGVALWDEDLKFVLCNDRYYEITLPKGFPKLKQGDCAIELGRTIFTTDFFVLPPGTDPSVIAEEIGETIRSYVVDLELERSDGQFISASSKKTTLGGYLITFRDITDRKRAETAEQKRWDILRDSIESLEEGFSLWDADFKLIMNNQKFMELVTPYRDTPLAEAMTSEELILELYNSGHAVIPKNFSEREYIEFWMNWARSHAGQIEAYFTDGRTVILSSKSTKLGGVLLTAIDVTEARKAEKAQKEAAELVQKVVEACPANFLMSRVEDGEVMFRSPASQELFGEKPTARGHWNNPEDRKKYITQLETHGRVDDMFVEGLKFDGSPFPSQVSAKMVDFRGEKVIVSSTTDLTEAFALRDERDASNALLRDAIEALDEGFVLYDKDNLFIMANDRFKQMLHPYKNFMKPGTHISKIIGQAFEDEFISFVEGDDTTLQDVVEAVRKLGSKKAEIYLADGSYKIITLATLNDGSIAATAVDVTAQRQAEEAALSANNLMADAFEAMDEGIMLYDPDLRLELINNRISKIFFDGNTTFELGKTFYEIWDGLVKSDLLINPQGVEAHERARLAEINVRRLAKNTTIRTTDGRTLLASSFKTDQGGYLLTFRNITDQMRAEQLLSDAISRLPVGVAVETPEGKLTHCNAAFASFYESTPEQLMALSFDERMQVLYPKIATVNDVAIKGDPMSFYYDNAETHRDSVAPIEANLKDGRHYLLKRAPTYDDGRVVVMTDITQLKIEEENRLTAINDAIEGTGEALVLFDRDAKFTLANKAYYEMFWSTLTPPHVGEPVESLFRRLLDDDFYQLPEGITKEQFFDLGIDTFYNLGKNLPMDTADGKVVLVSSHQTGLDGYLISFRDVTDQKNAERHRLEAVTDAIQSLTDGIALYDADFNFVLGNNRFFDMWFKGIEPAKIGENIISVFKRVIEADILLLPEGVDHKTFIDGCIDAANNYGKNLVLKTNEATISASSHKTALDGYLLEFTDITERLQTEQELQEQRDISHQNEKLSALGELLAGVAHELNNPLSVVFGYSQMLQGKVDDPKLSKRIDMIGQSAERAAKIVKTFLSMARQRPTKVELCSLNEVVATALEVSTYALTANGTKMAIRLDESIPSISGDFDQLIQVFTNLIVNAGHALEPKREKGILTIRSYYDAACDHAVVEVRDNGPGIPKNIQSRIFEPFFTTKEVGKGTGVGLAFSHRIVDSHCGILDVKSNPGKGTSFFVKLQSAKSVISDTTLEDHQPIKKTGKHVLVIDDEADVAQLVSDILDDQGFVVTTQTSPKEALHLLENAEYDAVVSDFKMPDMNGEQFFNAMKVLAPECTDRIGFMTGDAMSQNVRSFFVNSKRPHIEKPIIAEELVALVHLLCDHT